MSTTFFIKNENGDILNTIIATHEFVKSNYEFYEEVANSEDLLESTDELTLAYNGRNWRNEQLNQTDMLMLLPDYPYKEQLTAYRQALRDWPATEDFPYTKPELVV